VAVIPVFNTVDSVNGGVRSREHDAHKVTDAERAAGVTPANFAFPAKPRDLRRDGLVPNDASAAAFNANALNSIAFPTNGGPPGRLILPNVGGNDRYYIGDIVQLRSLLLLDLDFSELYFTKTRQTTDNYMGFLTLVQNVTVENGIITIDYDGTGGINAGIGIRVGARDSYPWGGYTGGILDDDDNVAQGNVILRNLKITSNNPAVAAPLVMIGGLMNVLTENVEIDGQGAHTHGIYYEFGMASTNGSVDPQDWTSSHAQNLMFRNIRVTDLKSDGVEGAGIALIGAGPSIVDGLSVDTAYSGIEVRPGEAMYYNVWSRDAGMVKRGMTLRNIACQNITNTGMTLVGAADPDATGTGYLNGAGLNDQQKTDLLQFSVDGFAIEAEGAGIFVSGPCSIRNGSIRGATSSGGLIISDECVQFDISNVRILNSDLYGVRADFGDAIFTTPRKKIGSIRNSQIALNTTYGIVIDNSQSVLIENCRIGYNAAYDIDSETSQTVGVHVGTNGYGVVCRGNFVSTSGGSAYSLAGTGPRGCAVYSPFGTVTYTGIWEGAVLNWTATLTPGTSGSISPISGQDVGRYTIRDKQVTATLYYGVNTVSSPVGTLTLSGLPVASASGTNGRSAVTFHGTGLGGSATGLSAQLGASASSITINTRFSAGSWSSNAADIVSSSVIVMSLTYMID